MITETLATICLAGWVWDIATKRANGTYKLEKEIEEKLAAQERIDLYLDAVAELDATDQVKAIMLTRKIVAWLGPVPSQLVAAQAHYEELAEAA